MNGQSVCFKITEIDLFLYCVTTAKEAVCQQLRTYGITVTYNYYHVSSLHRAGQRCFELLALIGSPQLSFSKVFPAEQTSWPNWQTLWACTEADA